jgi:hypothetical protein
MKQSNHKGDDNFTFGYTAWFICAYLLNTPKTLMNHQLIITQKQIESQIDVPINSPIVPTPTLPLSPYDYFALLPTLIVAATPLILGLKQGGFIVEKINSADRAI